LLSAHTENKLDGALDGICFGAESNAIKPEGNRGEEEKEEEVYLPTVDAVPQNITSCAGSRHNMPLPVPLVKVRGQGGSAPCSDLSPLQ